MAVPKKRQSKMKTRQRKANVRAAPEPLRSAAHADALPPSPALAVADVVRASACLPAVVCQSAATGHARSVAWQERQLQPSGGSQVRVAADPSAAPPSYPYHTLIPIPHPSRRNDPRRARPRPRSQAIHTREPLRKSRVVGKVAADRHVCPTPPTPCRPCAVVAGTLSTWRTRTTTRTRRTTTNRRLRSPEVQGGA